MSRWSALFIALAGCTSSFAAPAPPAPPPPPKDARSPAQIASDANDLITKQLVAMNDGQQFGHPTRQLNPGTVTPRQIPTATKTKTGFEVKFGNGSPVSTPAVYGGKVYTSGGFNSREFYTFEATTGQGAWGLDLSDDGPSTPACADHTCVFDTESCTVFAVDAATGKQRWAWFLGDPQTSAPAIADGRVFTSYPAGGVDASSSKPAPPSATHVLAAFDLKTGALQWQDWLDADVISSPVAVGEFLYVATFDGTVVKVEQATGKIRYATRARATSAPVVEFAGGLESMYYTRRADDARMPAKGNAGAPAAAEQIVHTDHNNPETRYTTPAKQADYLDDKVQSQTKLKAGATAHDAGNGFSAGAPPAAHAAAAAANIGQSNVATLQQFQGSRILHMSAVNVNTMGDEVVATNPDNGKELWTKKLAGDTARDGGFLGTPPLAAGKHVIVATLKGTILELDPKTGKTEATYQVGAAIRSQPVVDNGWIYVGTDDGRLVAIDTGDRALTGWPTWGGNAARTGQI